MQTTEQIKERGDIEDGGERERERKREKEGEKEEERKGDDEARTTTLIARIFLSC